MTFQNDSSAESNSCFAATTDTKNDLVKVLAISYTMTKLLKPVSM